MKQNNVRLQIVSTRIFAVFIILFSVASCGPANRSNVQSESVALESTPGLLQEMNNSIGAENANTETPTQTIDLSDTQETNTTAQVRLNPPHGEPGHSCDIPVGAPLDSPVSNTTVQPKQNTSVTTVTPTVNTASKPSAGRVGPTIENLKTFTPSVPINQQANGVTINPPHGQPGHRCDIPVGDPLPAVASNDVKLNPPHGQPGHRCDIPVGSPLPS